MVGFVLVETVGVAGAGAAHVWAATFVVGRTEEEDSIVGVFHAH